MTINIICVGCGGFLGAISRYIISIYTSKQFLFKIPLGTLIVNVLGGFLIGLIMELTIKNNFISPQLKLFLTTGIMGGLTTFSTFSYETIVLIKEGNILLAILNILLNLILSLLGVVLGNIVIK
ncbi:MAG: fluoride efflux transporter CrcB [Clostridiales bacterium]|uniref:fluoride efflux transporter CrcB n=1 Tax=Terrisporobacter sp. TaxID=1965305 RepID=UPI002A58B398|nr:fluoride efflux transporter CrcB [Terrisporobacter sp.]MDD7754403.1 fluoride efflux transporter CrcB [Clostridiales bacterium]MDY4135344.1 fluoride efflux transporter CrcB [Terrisporobacter sp.]MDY4737261.1 fluoride efflux transporter CrcB [Terrisporobacter sp.]MDY6154181.1 fluoride efflux transporter CrcB [Terrisporobacter sp.]